MRTRARLTLWYVLLLAGSLLGLGLLGFWTVERTLLAGADELLVTKAAAVQTEVGFERNRLVVDLANETNPDAPAILSGLDLVRVWDASRRLVFQNQPLPELDAEAPETIEALLSGQRDSQYRTVSGPNGAGLRLYAEPVRYRDRIVGLIQVGRSQADIEMVLSQLQLLGIAGALLALVWAGLGGYFLAGRALAPVDRITRAARRIGAEDLSERLNLPLPDDELGRLAAAFDEMIARLDEAFQRQRQFTADASHELRTPLTVIRSQIELALSRPREGVYDARVLRSIGEESERLAHLTESLLALARADSGEPVARAPLDFEDLVAETGARYASRARERGIELSVTIEPISAMLGDATWLTQLLLNLLDNALRHTPPGGRVALALRPAEGGLRLEVSDSGEGIPPEHLPRIFERFYRADRARARGAGGAGLGLAICAWVAQAHGGRLDVASTVGSGTTLSLWLPAEPPPVEIPVETPASAVPQPA